jgi:hypothetical protein
MGDSVPGPRKTEAELELLKLEMEVKVQELELRDRSSRLLRWGARAGSLVAILGVPAAVAAAAVEYLDLREKFHTAEQDRTVAVQERDSAVRETRVVQAGLELQTLKAQESEKTLVEVKQKLEEEHPSVQELRQSIHEVIGKSPAILLRKKLPPDPLDAAHPGSPSAADEYRQVLRQNEAPEGASEGAGAPSASPASREKIESLAKKLRPDEIEQINKEQVEQIRRERVVHPRKW